ncbi:MAG: hypothetical protein COW01_04515 [Bdellovibrionales bacterium CG12_big_fil_rev_8_21_14_0_65_38_15]|nr:MAG: hypothetical protein COW79_11835 [Bdellovibrionales bacterium CG22_combo_CG10-13_8_21_14_all_38_13]PIQ56321.1 MAG: hypothetical protein COW01_04515 [Bdellovibrionales bacterium CG12_big_fil_rev_8_21_14_0_65_38_15]PIR29352.1 MAG: hypothetical protein COV38_11450 [Bdellovibrionales bacterium CG11_big_fil_rev_8_21_14_0_20_38_13]
MKYLTILIFLVFPLASKAGSFLNWQLEKHTFTYKNKPVQIRAGYLEASSKVAFKGNILYYQGLADSMLNHDPLFQSLVNEGFRVIAFDYMGQGGSDGSMNNTTIENINILGDQIIKRFARKIDNKKFKYHLIGWSTGGLAAYRKAYLDKSQSLLSVTLIAPGIAPKVLVGEGLFNWPIDEISMRSLTSNQFIGVNDPHEDPIYPNSPVCVPKFALNLQATALSSRDWKIDEKIKGFVLLSDNKVDTYVNSATTLKVVRKNASHFKRITYMKTRHEIDNEFESIAQVARNDIRKFILSHN